MNAKAICTNFDKDIYFKQIDLKASSSRGLESNVINVYPKLKKQLFLGFGAALTESSTHCLDLLRDQSSDKLLKEVFDKNYNFLRIAIGSCDFALDSYSYSYKADLSDFSIEHEKKSLIKYLKKIKAINPDLKLLASPWSPPAFMKSNLRLTRGGHLNPIFKKTYAAYLGKYLLAMKEEGFEIDYISVQNEASALVPWESCLYSAKDETSFAVKYLTPEIKKHNLKTKILIWDHNTDKIYSRASQSYEFEEKLTKSIFKRESNIAGCAFHWYMGDHFDNIGLVAKKYPKKLLFHTEGCTGYSDFRKEDQLVNANIYAHDIIGCLKNGTHAYIDWNLLLDHKGGPNHLENYCDAPLMLGKDSDSVIKNLTWTYINHFSSYIAAKSQIIETSSYTSDLEVVAAIRPDKKLALVILNQANQAHDFNLIIENKAFKGQIDEKSIITILV